MKISIKHIENTFNYGSCMMAINLISRIGKEIDDVKFYVDCSTNEDLERLKTETGIRNIYRDNVESSENLIIKVINKLRRICLKCYVNKIKNVIVIGGDDISEYYTIERLLSELKRIKKESKKKKIILLGQTMGPFTGDRVERAKESLKNTTIFTRDYKNYEYLRELGFTNIKEGKDLAFLELPMQDKSNKITNSYNLECEKYITIVLSGLVNLYTKNYDCYIENQVKIIRNIISDKRLSDKKIVLLAHVLKPEHVDDRIVINKVVEKLSDEEIKRIVIIDKVMLPSEAREILGGGLFTITGRMHAAVSTFFMKKPAISLSYSIKYAGVIGKGLDMNELIIEAADEAMWSDFEVCNLVEDKISFILDNYDNLIDKIEEKISETTLVLDKELSTVIDDLKH